MAKPCSAKLNGPNCQSFTRCLALNEISGLCKLQEKKIMNQMITDLRVTETKQ